MMKVWLIRIMFSTEFRIAIEKKNMKKPAHFKAASHESPADFRIRQTGI